MGIFEYKNKKWDEFELLMTEKGFETCSSKMQKLNHQPQVYIHVGNEGRLFDKALRIGVSKKGAYYRCIKNNDGHMHTFYWATGNSVKYTEERVYRDGTANYMVYFANLSGLKTKLYVLSLDNYAEAVRAEKIFISELKPIWETFKQAHKVNKKFPILTGNKKDMEIFTALAKCGGAMKYLTAQRNDLKAIKLPEISEWDISPHGDFNLQSYLNS